jgi:hypothetical protein
MMTDTKVLSIVPVGCEYSPHVLVQCTVIIINISVTVFKEGAGSVFIRFAACITKNTFIACLSIVS